MNFHYEMIDHVQLAAPIGGEDRAHDFFHDLLGFEEVEKPKPLRKHGGVWFRLGAIHIHIGVEEDFRPAKKAHPAFRVGNIEGMKAYLLEQGVMFKVDNKLPGANRFYLDDPFGNRLEFLEWVE